MGVYRHIYNLLNIYEEIFFKNSVDGITTTYIEPDELVNRKD